MLRVATVGLLLIAASLPVCVAQPVKGSDEMSQVLAPCGKPRKNTQVRGLIPGSKARELTYGNIVFSFAANSGEPLPGYNFIGADEGKAVIQDRAALAVEMPCLAKAGWAAPALAAKPLHQAPIRDDGDGGYIIPFFLVLCIVVPILVWLKKRYEWSQRPKLLCLACKCVAQPSAYKNGRLYCPVCKADNPIPLETPAAKALLP